MKKPTEKQYREAAYELMSSHLPKIFSCGKCKWPVLDGYVCRYCGDESPYYDKKGKEVREWK